MKVKDLINKIKVIINNTINTTEYKNSFTFASLLSYLDLNIPDEAKAISHFSVGILILSLVVLFSFTNVKGYLCSILLLKHYKIGEKYQKLRKILTYFEKTTIFWIIIEGITGYIVLFIIILFSFLYFKSSFI
jgi:hypothetical protein